MLKCMSPIEAGLLATQLLGITVENLLSSDHDSSLAIQNSYLVSVPEVLKPAHSITHESMNVSPEHHYGHFD